MCVTFCLAWATYGFVEILYKKMNLYNVLVSDIGSDHIPRSAMSPMRAAPTFDTEKKFLKIKKTPEIWRIKSPPHLRQAEN